MSGERDPNDVDIAICVCCRRNLPCRHCPDDPKTATGDDLRDFRPDSVPEPTPSVTEPQEAPREQ